ncbi:MAG: hypothetical protein JWP44_5163, partial [Mucilaginibacter sp.]|nr:hypothetical protein [Mucilaginibacter sp.]
RDGTIFPLSYWSAPNETPSGHAADVAITDNAEQRKA